MTDPDSPALLVRRALEAFAAGDRSVLLDALHEDAVFHIPGTSPISGVHRGRFALLEFFQDLDRRSEGTLRVDLRHVLAGSDGHVLALFRLSAARAGRTLDDLTAYLFRVEGGRIVEARSLHEDQAASDRFW